MSRQIIIVLVVQLEWEVPDRERQRKNCVGNDVVDDGEEEHACGDDDDGDGDDDCYHPSLTSRITLLPQNAVACLVVSVGSTTHL